MATERLMAEAKAPRAGGNDAAPASAEAAQGGRNVLMCAESLLLAVRQQAEAGAALEAELGAEVEQHKAALQELKTENAAIASEVAAGRSTRMVLESEKKALLVQIDVLKKDRGELTKHLDEAAKASTRRLVALEKSHDELSTKLYLLEMERDELEKKYQTANEQLAAVNASSNPSSQDENADLNVRVEALLTVNNNLTGVIKALNAKHNELQTEYNVACEKLAAITPDETGDPEHRAQAGGQSTAIATSSAASHELEAEMTRLRSTNEALRSAILALKPKVRGINSMRSSIAKLMSENTTLRATAKLLDNRLRAAEAAHRNINARHMVAFMRRFFALAGNTKLLRAAFEAFFDDKAFDASGGGRFAPKPVLLVHQVEIPQLTVAAAAPLAPPTVASGRSDDTRMADSATPAVVVPQGDAEEEETKREGSSEGEQSDEEREGGRDESSHNASTITLPKNRGQHARDQEPRQAEQQAASRPSRTASELPPVKLRRTTAGADADAATPLSVFSNPRQSTTHYRVIAPRPPQLPEAFYNRMIFDAGGGGGRFALNPIGLTHQAETPQVKDAPASERSLVSPTVASDRFGEARTVDNAASTVPARPRESGEEEKKRGGSSEDEQSEGEGGGNRERMMHKTPSRPLSRTRERRPRNQAPQRTRQRVGTRATKRRRTTAGSDADAAITQPQRSVAVASRPPRRSVRSEPDSHTGAVDDPDAVTINEIDLRLLYEAEPWEAMYEKRPLFSHTVDYSSLPPGAKRWLEMALVFRHKYRRQLWEQQHWVVIARPHSSATLARMLEERTIRQAQARFAWTTLMSKADDLIRREDLDLDVWHDPFLWRWTDEPRLWQPTSCNLVEELEALDEEEPARCFYVDCLRRHPFYAGRLFQEHQDPHRLPPGF